MKNNLNDLNNYLFEIFEKLSDDELTGEKLKEEINRSKAVADIASLILANANLMLKASVAKDNFLNPESTLPKITEG